MRVVTVIFLVSSGIAVIPTVVVAACSVVREGSGVSGTNFVWDGSAVSWCVVAVTGVVVPVGSLIVVGVVVMAGTVVMFGTLETSGAVV